MSEAAVTFGMLSGVWGIRMKPSISEISRISGFSPATVSNALHNKKGVNPETAKKVLQLAQECGYTVKNKISSIKFVIYKNDGLVVSNTPFFTSLIAGVVGECKNYGYETAIFNLDKSAPDYLENFSHLVNENRSAILLLATEITDAEIRRFENFPQPVVLLDSCFELLPFNSVMIDNADSAYQSVQYLVEKGHRRIGYLMGSERIKNFIYRQQGFEQALLANGITPDRSYYFPLLPTMDGACEDMGRLLERDPAMPTAFFADNDIIALGAMKALQSRGYQIPRDVSLIGFDDIPFCTITSPTLTTNRVYNREMGQLAVRRLVEVIRKGSEPKIKSLICNEFIERESVRQL